MNTRRTLLLAAVLGVVALSVGWLLLSLGRTGDTARDLPAGTHVDAAELLHLTETLSSDALQGRAIGTPGNEAARGFLRKRFESLGLKTIGTSYEHPFEAIPPEGGPADAPVYGTNLIGLVEGETPGEGRLLVVTAHFDHLGVVDGDIYNGADDNASGAAALVAVAAHFAEHPPKHDILFALLDGEEAGFLGARNLVQSGLVDMSRVALNLNFDMVSRSDAGELYVAGTYHFPGLVPLVERVAAAAEVTLLAGHDRPELGHDDWTLQSDHAAFYEAGIPFLYFGVEDHPDYHQPTDDFGKIPRDFFVRSADTLVLATIAADEMLDTLDLGPAEPGPASQ